MDQRIDAVLAHIEHAYREQMQPGARHYLEVSLAETARKLGYGELSERYTATQAIIPLKQPQRGMKVRIDGRTFVNYAEFSSGMAVPGYVARMGGREFRSFVPNDSMICNFC